jgi:hypothetical protein
VIVRNSRQTQSGIGSIEFLIALPLLLALGLGAWQWVLVLQARQLLEHAAFEAVRAGAVGHASESSIDHGLARGLIAFWMDGAGADPERRVAQSLERLRKARHESWMDWRQLSPTRQSFIDWAEPAIDQAGRPIAGVLEIPVDNLDARVEQMRPASGVSAWLGAEPMGQSSAQTLRDASVLRLELQVALPLRVPVAGRLIAAVSGWPGSCKPPCLFARQADADDGVPRMLLRVHAEARMQSPARASARTPDRLQSVPSTGPLSASPLLEPVAALPIRGEAVEDVTVRGSGVTRSGDPAGGPEDRLPHAAASSSGAPVAGVPNEKAPLQDSDFVGELWAPGACGIAPG